MYKDDEVQIDQNPNKIKELINLTLMHHNSVLQIFVKNICKTEL